MIYVGEETLQGYKTNIRVYARECKKSSKRESYMGPPSNTGDKYEAAYGKETEITPPKPDQA